MSDQHAKRRHRSGSGQPTTQADVLAGILASNQNGTGNGVPPGKRGRRGKRRGWPARHRLLRIAPELVLCALYVAFAVVLFLEWDLAADALQVVALAAAVVMPVAALLRAWWAAALWATTAVVLLLPFVPQFLPRPGGGAAGCTITALTFNAKLARGVAVDDVAALIEANPADIVFLQEAFSSAEMLAALGARAPFRSYASRVDPVTGGLVILSRYPLFPADSLASFFGAQAQIAGERVQLLTSRTTTPVPLGLVPFGRSAARAAEIDALQSYQAKSALPTVIGADLNAGPFSPAVRRLEGTFTDVFGAAGFGFGATFPSPARRLGRLGAWLRIDFLLVSGAFLPVSAAVVPGHAGSTHYPLRATMAFQGRGTPGERCGP